MTPPDAHGGDSRIPVNVITGFLGSGKTTLLRRLLASPALADTAVIINEIGEIGIDHHLIDYVDQEVVLLKNGCVCCGIRTDLRETLANLLSRSSTAGAAPTKRVLIETTGLADPVPVLNTLALDEMLRHQFRVGTVLTTVDAVCGMAQLAQQPESLCQAAVADRLVITKADLADRARLDTLVQALGRLNPTATCIVSDGKVVPSTFMLDEDSLPANCLRGEQGWLPAASAATPTAAFGAARATYHGMTAARALGVEAGAAHLARIRTASLVFDRPLDWIVVGTWLSMLLHRYGKSLLRLKGILNIEGADRPTVVHGVQHLMHPPVHLDAWPTPDRRSRLVLIGDLPPAADLQASLERFIDWR